MIRIILISAGTIFLVIGVIGIFVPGLPTTPFLLLTAATYVRSSERLYQMIIKNRFIGHYITEYQRRRGMTARMKWMAILVMWLMIAVSIVTLSGPIVPSLIIAGAGVIGTVVMGWVVPTAGKNI